MKHIETSTLAERNTHNLWSYRRADLQWNRCRHNQNGKPVESPLSNCLVETIIMKQYLGHEEDWDRVRVKRADLLYEDYSSKFDSWNQLQNSSMCCLKYFLIFPKHRQPFFPSTWVRWFFEKIFRWVDLSGRVHAQYLYSVFVCVFVPPSTHRLTVNPTLAE